MNSNFTLDDLKGYKRGNELVCHCPNPDHKDSNPSFNLNLETGCYFCFGCGLRGKLDLSTGRPFLFSKEGLKKKIISFDDTKLVYHNYLKKRGIGRFTAWEFAAGYSPSYRAVVFPCFDLKGGKVGDIGRLVYESKYRYLYSTNFDRSNYLFNLGIFKPLSRSIILVEGIFDCLKLFALKFKNTFAILGTWLSKDQHLILSNLGIEKIYLCLDSDKTGFERSKEIGLTLINKGFDVRICELKNRNDPAEIENRDEFLEVLKQSKTYYDFILEGRCGEVKFAFEN